MTLEVTPEQAEMLDLARSVGTLSLVLRNQVDPELGQDRRRDQGEAAGRGRPRAGAAAGRIGLGCEAGREADAQPAPAVATVPRKCIAVITGMEITRECF